MSIPTKQNLFLEDDDHDRNPRDFSPANRDPKELLLNILASRKGNGTKDARSRKE